MSTLREVLEQANVKIQQEITADAVKRLSLISKNAIIGLNVQYGKFFQYLSDNVVNDPDMSAETGGVPAILEGETYWEAVSQRWWEVKTRAAKSGNASSLNFYHGITGVLIKATRAKGKHRGGIAKQRLKAPKGSHQWPKSKTPFNKFIASLAGKGQDYPSSIFGKLGVTFELIRPDGGKVTLRNLEEAVAVVRQFRPTGQGKKTVIASAIDGTILRVNISAFSKVLAKQSEESLLDYMMSVTKVRNQWYKVAGGSNRGGSYRPILLPTIQWYLKHQFPTSVAKAVRSARV